MYKKLVKAKKTDKAMPETKERHKAPINKVVAQQAEGSALHNLIAPSGSHKLRKIKGRGPSSGHGKTSTRGSKGQTSRAGRHFYLGFEGGTSPLIRRIPKRGFTSRSKMEYQIVNLRDLARIKEPNITLELMKEKGLIKDKSKPVKILGDGQVKIAISIQAHAFSRKAALDIESSGGKIEVVNV